MNRRFATVVVALLPVLATSGCAGLLGGGEPADADAIARYAEPQGIAHDLVYVTDVDGLIPNPMSVGVMGDDGFSAQYAGEVDGGYGTIMLTTWHGDPPDPAQAGSSCAELPDTVDGSPACYVQPVDGTVVLLEGDNVGADTMRAAGAAVRPPTTSELSALFADAPAPAETTGDRDGDAVEPDGVQRLGGTTERDDLPEFGDGAPQDPPHVGG